MIIDTVGHYDLPASNRFGYEHSRVRLRTAYDRQMIMGDVLAIPIGVVLIDLDGQQYTDCFVLNPHDRFGSYYGTHTADIDRVLAHFKSIDTTIQTLINFGGGASANELERHEWHNLIHKKIAPLFESFRTLNFIHYMNINSEYVY